MVGDFDVENDGSFADEENSLKMGEEEFEFDLYNLAIMNHHPLRYGRKDSLEQTLFSLAKVATQTLITR
jgi:hypothetical protein